jgi:hypothetical protein
MRFFLSQTKTRRHFVLITAAVLSVTNLLGENLSESRSKGNAAQRFTGWHGTSKQSIWASATARLKERMLHSSAMMVRGRFSFLKM